MNEQNEYTNNYEFRHRIHIRSNDTYIRNDPSLSVQAFINNFSFPTSIDELRAIIKEGSYSLETLLEDEETGWTVPKWAKQGDIVFFMHARTAITKITALTTEVNREKQFLSKEEYETMNAWLIRAKKLYQVYGGKIMAIGRVTGEGAYIDNRYGEDVPTHWKSRIYADIDSIILLENPVDLSEFKSFITLTLGGAITPVFGKEFERLRKLIGEKNRLPRYVEESVSIPVPLRDINRYNWMEIAGQYRRSFMLEIQFRSFYVNYLLTSLGDRRKIYRECRCCKRTNPDSYVDNVILFNGRYLSVEVKLNIKTEPKLKAQVIKYCSVEKCYLSNQRPDFIDYTSMYDKNVLIIDTYGVYIYDADKDDVMTIFDLDKLTNMEDISSLRRVITSNLKVPVYHSNNMSSIAIYKTDITQLNTDAIVNASNTRLKAGGGVSKAIFEDAGFYQLQAECRKIGRCDVGSAVITPGFYSTAKYIIHAVGPKYIDGKHNEPQLLYSAYMESLKLAEKNGCHSITFPLISTGTYKYPIDHAWEIALQACTDYIGQNTDYKMKILFAVMSDQVISAGMKTLQNISKD